MQPLSHLPKNVTCSALLATMSHCSRRGSKKRYWEENQTQSQSVCQERARSLPVYVFNTKFKKINKLNNYNYSMIVCNIILLYINDCNKGYPSFCVT